MIERGKSYTTRQVVEAMLNRHYGMDAVRAYREKRKRIDMAQGTVKTGKQYASSRRPVPQAEPPIGAEDTAPWEPDWDDDDAPLGFDFDGIEDSGGGMGGFDVISAGAHLAFIEHIEKTKSKSGNNMFKVLAHVYAGEDSGKSKWTYIVLGEDFMWKLKQLMSAVGISNEEMPKMSLGKIQDRALDTMVTIVVRATEYNDKPSCDIVRIDPPDRMFGIEPGTKRTEMID